MKVYYSKLLKFSHENLLKPIACYDVFDTFCAAEDEERYGCILFEDYLGRLHELRNLLFASGREGCNLSTLGRNFVFAIGKTLDFLRVNQCYHGALAIDNIYIVDLSDEECRVKIGGLQGLLNCGDYDRAWANDLFNFGHSIEELLKANDKSPHPVLQDYVDKLKSNSPATFLFSHALWLNFSRKKSLVLAFGTIDYMPVMSNKYWPNDPRLNQLASSDTRHLYPKTFWGLTKLLKDTLLHPRYTPAYEDLTQDFEKFLEAVESKDPYMWIKLVEVAVEVMDIGWSLQEDEERYYAITQEELPMEGDTDVWYARPARDRDLSDVNLIPWHASC